MRTDADRSMGVLYIDSSVGFGGATRSLSLLWQGLPEIRKHVLTSQGADIVSQCYGAAQVHRFRRVLNYRLLGRVRRWGRVAALVATSADAVLERVNSVRVRDLARRHDLGLIHCNNGPTPREALFGALAARVPCVAHIRGFLPRGRRESVLRLRTVDRYVAVSHAVAASVVAGGAPAERVVTIHDPVDIARFAATADARVRVRRHMKLADGDFAAGIFGRVVPWKGQLEFVQAVLRALPECPELKGIIVGDESDGDPDYMRRVRECADASGHGDRFVFAGYQPAVEEFYHAVDTVVHASIETEPFGMVVPEAMAARKPVIAAAEGGPAEVIADGEDGLLVRPGDIEGLATALRTLARDPERRLAMGARGFEKVAGSLTVEHIAAQVRRVYEEVLGADQGGGRAPWRPSA